MTKTVVLGLDGANWGLIDSWITEGELPNIKRLREKATDATSQSELPPVTCPNWKCYSSSKNPGELGVFWWEFIDPQKGDITFPDANSFQTAELWDYLGDAGLEWLCLNMPTTYPPRDVSGGRIIAGGPLCADSGFTVDSEFERLLEDKFGYKVRPDVALTSNENSEQEVEAILSLIEIRFDVLEWYLDEHDPDIAHVTIFLLNILQHYFWDGPPVKEAWKRIDEGLGRIEDQTQNLVLMSDHGCSPVDTVFHVNAWLENEGYLTTETSLTTYLARFGLTKERVSAATERLGVRTLARNLPRSFKNVFPQEDEGAKREAKSSLIDWDETEVVGSGQGPVYLKDRTDIRKTDLVEKLTALKTPTGQPVASTIYTKEEAYSGKNLDIAPELIIKQAPGIHISDGIGVEEVFTPPSRWDAENDRDGLFLAVGDDFSAGSLDQISIKDIAPTLLYLMDVPIPRDMEGEVLDIFETDLEEVSYQKPIDIRREKASTETAVEDRLEDLGYIGQ